MTDPTDVLARDGRRCVNCESAVTTDRPPEDAVWDLGTRDIEAESVAVCGDCASVLRGEEPAWRRRVDADPADGALDFLRTVTRTQGSAVADVAALATDTAGGIDEADERRDFLDGRRQSGLRLAVIDRQLAVAGVDAGTLEPAPPGSPSPDDVAHEHVLSDAADLDSNVVAAFETVLTTAVDLQTQLRTVLDLVETAVAVEGACHVCLESVVGVEACPSCETPVRDGSAWRDGPDELDTAGLYGTITRQLEAASDTTTRLTDCSASLADRLAE